MESKLTKEELNRLRDVSIHTLLGLTNNGRRVKIVCPFHADKDPSLTIYPDNSYKCYGCGAYGRGAVDFVMAFGVSFIDALEELSRYI